MLDLNLLTGLILLARQPEEYDAPAQMVVELQVLCCLAVGDKEEYSPTPYLAALLELLKVYIVLLFEGGLVEYFLVAVHSLHYFFLVVAHLFVECLECF